MRYHGRCSTGNDSGSVRRYATCLDRHPLQRWAGVGRYGCRADISLGASLRRSQRHVCYTGNLDTTCLQKRSLDARPFRSLHTCVFCYSPCAVGRYRPRTYRPLDRYGICAALGYDLPCCTAGGRVLRCIGMMRDLTWGANDVQASLSLVFSGSAL